MYKVCDVKLTYNTKVKSSERAVIKDSNSAYSLLMNHIYDSETIQYREYVKLILLNNAKKGIGNCTYIRGWIGFNICRYTNHYAGCDIGKRLCNDP